MFVTGLVVCIAAASAFAPAPLLSASNGLRKTLSLRRAGAPLVTMQAQTKTKGGAKPSKFEQMRAKYSKYVSVLSMGRFVFRSSKRSRE